MTEHLRLVRRLQAFAYHINETHSADSQDEKTVREAASTLEALQAENAELKEQREQLIEQVQAAVDDYNTARNDALNEAATAAEEAAIFGNQNEVLGSVDFNGAWDLGVDNATTSIANAIRALKKDSPNGE